MPQRNQYDPDSHDEYITCPRSKCAARNAPQGSDEFDWSCWKCGADLPVEQQEVQVGDEIEVEIFDIHENGSGVGRTESGFIVLVDGVLPECRARVEITRVNRSSARGELLEKLPLEDEDSATEESEAEDDTEQTPTPETGDTDSSPALGSRDNYWG